MLWNPETKQVLLARLDESSLKSEERGARTFVKDYYRVKTYASPGEMLLPQRDRSFSEPYMFASSEAGGTWNDHVAPFTVQVAGCNANCVFCFVPAELRKCDETRGAYFTAGDIVRMRDEHEPGRKTIRVSGGEPFLAPGFIEALADELQGRGDTFLWIDTNLMGSGYEEAIGRLSSSGVHYGICGCFKGYDPGTFAMYSGLPGKRYESQWKNAALIRGELMKREEERRLFFYVPELLFLEGAARGAEPQLRRVVERFFNQMRERVGENAPLRTTVLSLKEYEANKGWKERVKAPRGVTPVEPGTTKKAWLELIDETYPAELAWLPQYQVF